MHALPSHLPIKKTSALILISLLHGCATPQIPPEQLSKTHGYLYASFPKGTQGKTLTLKSLRGEFTLNKRSDNNLDALGEWLPEGEYKVHKWGSSNWGEYPTITVKSGKLTDLGSFIPLQIGDNEYVMLPFRHKDLSAGPQNALNEYSNALKSDQPIYWNPTQPPLPIKDDTTNSGLGIIVDAMLEYDRHVNKSPISKRLRTASSLDELFTLAKETTPPLYSEPAIDEHLNLYYGADLGQLRVRKTDAIWSSIDTGAIRPVTSVAVHGQHILSGFDDGSVRKSSDEGRSWSEVLSLGKNKIVVDIDKHQDGWLLLVANIKLTPNGEKIVSTVEVVKSSDTDLTDARTIRKIDINERFYFTIKGEIADNYYYASLFPRLERLNLNTGEWKDITPPTNVFNFQIPHNNTVISAYRADGIFSKLFLSTNNGESWTEHKSPPYIIQHVSFNTPMEGQAVRWRMGAFSGNLEYLTYASKQDKWVKSAKAPSSCIRALNDGHGASIFCVTRRGDILRKNNNQWIVEYSLE